MNIGTLELPGGSPVILAPMAGVTDYAFRTVCASLGAAVTVTEMVSSRALVYQDKKSRGLMRKNPGSLCGVQIFGNDPAIMAAAAQLAVELSGCDFIDINMGCPMPKVAQNGDGCALMRTPELAGQIVRAVADAVAVPVTVKCRKGWDRGSVNVVDFAARMEQSGAAAVAVHGRTKSMLYSGAADWDIIAQVKRAVSIPVIANGDVTDGPKALKCLQWTGADGVMVGRASFGCPWVLRDAADAVAGREIRPLPPLAERVDTALWQFRLAAEDKGEHIACLEARKHFAWYLRGVAYANYYKDRISHLSSAEEVQGIAQEIKENLR